ncbi:FKBP-type peptidyl-prolyl cis-trans isomerase [Pedobacter rhodius]|uniref:Peptidyl-prolyl cis-trans isomerase n=1 Tax=Pedobacter rhodius TaxID=3004098 RepID=A0ABT4L4H2_9SPHI|nr:FKBP-type peptidyl-prolyl cis-trans isomerase [Pedobacter sp. SJ11]MCZ4224953.1 FKBP-type peptidyl-prolyl cis-trans isomerase [Pedobacter sp. SJ11]
MVKIRHFLLLVYIAGCFTACKKLDVGEVYDPVPQFKADTTAIRAFVKLNNIPVLKDEGSGVFYQIIVPGSGSHTYTTASSITVDYAGKLLNGTVFDASNGTLRTFVLGNLIPGWQVAIPKIQKGGQIRFFVPSYFGYGNTTQGSIPANSVLDFTVTLNNTPN